VNGQLSSLSGQGVDKRQAGRMRDFVTDVDSDENKIYFAERYFDLVGDT